MANDLSLPQLPATLKPIAHQLKIASEHANRDAVVAYWARLAALNNAMKLDKSSKEAKAVLLPLMDWLEKEKKVLSENEAITSEIVASAHIENYALKLFGWADREDRASRFGKNVVKAFYTAGNLFDVLQVFGELTPENAHARKYAKWKAAYIHNCLKNGETPVPGPAEGLEDPEMGGAVGGVDVSAPPPPPAEEWQEPQIKPTPTPRTIPSPNAPIPDALPPQPEVTPSGSGTNERKLNAHQVSQTKKYCKYASSALDYDDKETAVNNLQKALHLLQTGQELK